MTKKELWLKIANYNFDHLVPTHLWDVIASKFGGANPSLLAFSEKLQNKLQWDEDFTLKAIWEYKKYVYLGVISKSPVTPSKIIDQVWHEHLLFSVGYRTFCEEVICYDFNHYPELVPVSSQSQVFEAQYLYTLALYNREFGSNPPSDIWGVTKFKGLKLHNSKSYDWGSDYGDTPLITDFSGATSDSFEFGHGEFGGGGAGGGWDDGSGADNDSDGDSGDSDGGSDGGDGGGCSSGCGGGCGGD